MIANVNKEFEALLRTCPRDFQKNSIPISVPGKLKTVYVPENDILDFIRKISKLTKITVEGMNFQAKLQNFLYVDLDFHVEESKLSDYLTERSEVLENTIGVIRGAVTQTITDFGMISFAPEDESSKQGLHSFIWSSEIISQSDRNVIKRNLEQSLNSENNLLSWFVDRSDPSHPPELPDPNPMGINSFILLPFCEKAGASRRYRMIQSDLKDNLENFSVMFEFENQPSKTSDSHKFKEVSVFQEIEKLPCKCTSIILKSFANLMFLSDSHPLFKRLSDSSEVSSESSKVSSGESQRFEKIESLEDENESRLSYSRKFGLMHNVVKMSYLAFLYDSLISKHLTELWKDVQNICFTIIKNLLVRFHVDDPDSKFLDNLPNDLSKVMSELPEMERLKLWQKEKLSEQNETTNTGQLFSDFLFRPNLIKPPHGNEKDQTEGNETEEEDEKEYQNRFDDLFDSVPEDSNQTKQNEKSVAEIINPSQIISTFRKLFKFVLSNLTNEFVSFNPVQKTVKINGMNEQYWTRENDISGSSRFSNNMFLSFAEAILPIEIYENENLENVLSEFINNWISWSVFVKTESNAKLSKTIYIYNLFQSPKLYFYPYNQWIIDSTDIFHDIAIFYYSKLSKLLETSSARARIYPILNLIGAAKQDLTSVRKLRIKPLVNFGKTGYSSIRDGIYNSEKTTTRKFDELDQANSDCFPVRDGWLIFNNDGTVKHSTDNYGNFMSACTNLIYDRNFKNNYPKEFQETEKYLREIFPIDDEREYMLKCLSSVLNGKIKKDTLFIQYGSGSDGKTFLSNVFISLLGGSGESKVSDSVDYLMERIKGRDYKINSVPNSSKTNSLGSSVKSELLFEAQQLSNSTDEGGKMMMKGKRFSVFQEPDSRGRPLNGSIIKDILSGAPVPLRGIYENATTARLNMLLFLQTNSRLNIDDATDGTKRRVKNITMRSKFYTATTKETFKNTAFNFRADPNLQTKIESSIKMRSALLNLLIPYCCELSKNNQLSISDIEMPVSYKLDTEAFFKDSTGGFGLFSEAFLVENPKRFIPFSVLFQIVKGINENGYSERDEFYSDKFPQGCFAPFRQDGRSKRAAAKNLLQILSDFFVGRIYVVRDYIEAKNDELFQSVMKNETEVNPSEWKIDFEEFKERFLEPDAKTEIERNSKERKNYSDIFIGGLYWNTTEEIDPETGERRTITIVPNRR